MNKLFLRVLQSRFCWFYECNG